MTGRAFSDDERAGVYRAIASRRDIRNYRPDIVPDDVLGRILAAAHQAPSVGLMQPWDFVLIRDRSLRQRIYDHFRLVNERAGSVYDGARAERYRALKLQGILDAPLNLLVTCDRRRGGPHVLGRYTMRHTDEYSTCLAVQNLWLAARAEGVGVGWMSLLEPEFIAECLALPEQVIPVAYLTLGYPVEFPSEPMLERTGWADRRPLEDAVHVDRFGARALPPARRPEARDVTVAAVAAPHDEPAERAARSRLDELTKPVGSLGVLEQLALQLAALQGRAQPSCHAPALLLFAGDHGINEAGVSAYLPRATAQMVYQYLAGGGAVNALCRQHGVRLLVTDVGVDHDFGAASGLIHHKVRRGTRNFLHEPAMTESELDAALSAGAEVVSRARESDVIALGEMGIGNTTASAAVFAAVAGLAAEEVVGAGTNVSNATLARKADVVRRALTQHAPRDAMDALRHFGGLEMAALVGAIQAASHQGQLVVLDGFITGVAALVACERDARVKAHLVAGHVSAERAHRRLLERLGLRPLFDLGLRLGEGSGAVLALSLVESAARLMSEMRTFGEANLERPTDPRDAGASSTR
jgi:nicotinate-nucleotide--dimethylbenzimidazole phosphoribosyltransferase